MSLPTLLLELALCDCSAVGGGKRRSFLGSLFHRSKEPASTPDTPSPVATQAKPEEEKAVKVKRSNSNALVLQLGSLAREPTPITGDPCFCYQCGAAVSHISQLTTQAQTTSWKWLVLMCPTRSKHGAKECNYLWRSTDMPVTLADVLEGFMPNRERL